MRFGSTGDPFTWYISHPAKCGPLTSHLSRLPSAVRINAPFLVPTRTLTLLIAFSFKRLRIRSAINHPRDAELIDQHTKSGSPRCPLDYRFHPAQMSVAGFVRKRIYPRLLVDCK